MSNAFTSDPRVIALVVALSKLRDHGVEGCNNNLTVSEAKGLLDGTCDFETVAATRGVKPSVLCSAWSYEFFQLTGTVAIPVDETKAARASRSVN